MAKGYINTLKEENAAKDAEIQELRRQLEQQGTILPLDKGDENDYRSKVVTILYGPHRQAYQFHEMPLGKAFRTLVDYYSSFNLSTNRNIPKEVADPNTLDATKVNQSTVYAKVSYRDIHSKQQISTIRDLPLWLAVDLAVQQGRDVELISEEEFMSWYNEHVKQERMGDPTFRKALQNKKIELAVQKELQKEAHKETDGTSLE